MKRLTLRPTDGKDFVIYVETDAEVKEVGEAYRGTATIVTVENGVTPAMLLLDQVLALGK